MSASGLIALSPLPRPNPPLATQNIMPLGGEWRHGAGGGMVPAHLAKLIARVSAVPAKIPTVVPWRRAHSNGNPT